MSIKEDWIKTFGVYIYIYEYMLHSLVYIYTHTHTHTQWNVSHKKTKILPFAANTWRVLCLVKCQAEKDNTV